jgi:hypothetical protein
LAPSRVTAALRTLLTAPAVSSGADESRPDPSGPTLPSLLQPRCEALTVVGSPPSGADPTDASDFTSRRRPGLTVIGKGRTVSS